MKQRKILLIGGSGMVGAHIANALVNSCDLLIVPTRRKNIALPISLLPNVRVIYTPKQDEENLTKLMQGIDIVINLTGILHGAYQEKGFAKSFQKVHVDFVQAIINAMQKANVRRFIQSSALGASENAPSGYYRSKAAGEKLIFNSKNGLEPTVLRPSLIIGSGNGFLFDMAKLIKLAPVVPLFDGQAHCQPILATDVARAVIECLNNKETIGKTYELTGPKVYLVRDLFQQMAQFLGVKRCFPNMPILIAKLTAPFVALLPNPPFSPDFLRTTRFESIASGEKNLPNFSPEPIENALEAFLSPQKGSARFNEFRAKR